MRPLYLMRNLSVVLFAAALCGCAGVEPTIAAPGVSLRNVLVKEVDYNGQTFLLGIDVTNPNPFPLPIRAVSYGVELDGQHFAGGKAQSSVSVPANSDAEFSISVRLNLLRTAPALLHIVHDGATRDIPYRLKGELAVDIPAVKPVAFDSRGEIRLHAARF